MIMAGIVLGVFFWILESGIHAYIFHHGSFIQELIPPDPNEIWMRTVIVFLFLTLGIYSQFTINRRQRVEKALEERVRLEALAAHVGVALAEGDTLRTLLQSCAAALVEGLGVAFARIWTLNEKEQVLELQASAGIYTRIDGTHSRVPVGETKIGIIGQDCQPILINEISGDPHFPDQEWINREGMVAFAGYPLVLGEQLVGVMSMFARRPLPEVTLKALAQVADQISQGIVRQMAEQALRESERELRLLSSQLLIAQETERKRIARELHDGVGQILSTIKVRVETVLKQASLSEGKIDLSRLEDLLPAIKQTMEEVRNISMDLRPPTLDSLGILATISWCCREFQTTYPSVQVKQQIDVQEDEVAESLKIVIYRILQEALNNVARHSKADQVQVQLCVEDGSMTLAVDDNGRGFNKEHLFSEEIASRGFGLASMRERTESSGGSFAINSTEGQGTVVRAVWPMQSS